MTASDGTTKMRHAVPKLGRRELEIMNAVWNSGEVTVREVRDHIGSVAYTTVLAMMRTLENQKGVLRHREQGKTFIYSATVSREQVSQTLITDLCKLVFGGSTPSLVSNLLGQNPPSSDDIDALKKIIASNEEKIGQPS